MENAHCIVLLTQESGLHQLVQRIGLLQKENEALTGKHEEVCEKLQQLQKDREKLEDELVMYRETPLTVGSLECPT